MRRIKYSIVEYLPERDGGSCGYCKCPNSYYSSGLWAHSMSTIEYQILLDRGWRRSGHYMYKPDMRETCCPLYTIRCDVGELRLTKSQKKVLKKFYNSLKFGGSTRDLRTGAGGNSSSMEGECSSESISSHMERATSVPAVAVELNKIEVDASLNKEDGDKKNIQDDDVDEVGGNKPSTSTGKRGTEEILMVESRPRKAKLIRLENKYTKLRKKGMSEEEASQLTYGYKKANPEKSSCSIEDYFLRPADSLHFIHEFKTVLHPVSQLDEVILEETHRLYAKYQIAVHGDSPADCTMKQLKRFLVDSPLFDSNTNRPLPSGFGSFHQQYWLDGRLIAVGVIDILPKCVSSVYFFYDPDLRHLTLGTYGSLHEMQYTRELKKLCPSIKFYYLGYYIHNCPKMSYKGRYCPSYLLCPETFTWHRIEKCCLLLEKNKYVRFEADPNVPNELQRGVNLEKVGILHNNLAMGYQKYKEMNPNADDEVEVTEYARLVGEECCLNLLLHRKKT